MATKEVTVEDKLYALCDLQVIYSKLGEIKVLKGELPMEVKDLEDEIAGLETRSNNLSKEVQDLKDQISERNLTITNAEALIAKYEGQQRSVKNSREYDALLKEIEMQKLDIQLSQKKIKDAESAIEIKGAMLAEAKEDVKVNSAALTEKKSELDKIIADTEKEETKLLKKLTKEEKKVEDHLLNAFKRISHNYRNGLAVVTIQRDSCGGCFAKIPPQRQLEIRQRKKIIVCEHCGRILVDQLIATEEQLPS